MRKTIEFLSTRERVVYFALICLRITMNLLDFVAIYLVATLAGSIPSITSSQTGEPAEAVFTQISVGASPQATLLFALLLFLTKSLGSAAVMRVTVSFLSRVEVRAAERILTSVTNKSISEFSSSSKGNLLWTIQTSVQHGFSGMLTSISNLIAEGTLALGVFIVFFIIDPEVSAAVTGYFLIVAFIYQILVGNRLRKTGSSLAESYIRLADELEGIANTFREIMIFSRFPAFEERAIRARRDYSRSNATQIFTLSLPRYVVEIALVFALPLLWIVVESLFPGRDIAELGILFVVGGLRIIAALLPLQTAVSNLRIQIPQAKHAIDALRANPSGLDSEPADVIHQPNDGIMRHFGSLASSNQAHRVDVIDVDFAHSSSSKEVLRNVSLSVKSGSLVSFVGPSGSGKSTLADLIAGLNAPTRGQVLVSGVPAEELLTSDDSGLCYVPQRPGLIKGTLFENITLHGSREPSVLEAVMKSVREANLEEFVRNLPHGLETNLGEQSNAVSGGERQRIGLARALYFQPKLLILDEISGALDPESERLIWQSVEKLRGEVTIISIAHRLRTVKSSDEVFLFESGKIVERGSFSDLDKKHNLSSTHNLAL